MLLSAQKAITALTQGKTLRIWSYLITIFGDLAQGQGQWISSRTLGLMCEGVGAKLESQRVAIHRLRKDGWLQIRKEGRRSFYSLSPAGREQASHASLRIYSNTEMQAQAWLVIHQAGAPSPFPAGIALNITPHIWISSRAPMDASTLSLPLDAAHPLPSWLAEKVCGTDLVEQSQDLRQRLQAVQTHLDGEFDKLNVSERAFIRTLVVHDWRRLVLKAPALPDFLFPRGWAGPECKRQTFSLLDALGPCDLRELNQIEAGDAKSDIE